MGPRTDWEHLSREVQKDRRKGRRVPLAFPIEVHGFDSEGCLFRERTATCDVSESGCRFQLKTRLQRGDVVALRILSSGSEEPASSRPLLFQVAWCAPEADMWMAGVFMLHPKDIWGVGFPRDAEPTSSAD